MNNIRNNNCNFERKVYIWRFYHLSNFIAVMQLCRLNKIGNNNCNLEHRLGVIDLFLYLSKKRKLLLKPTKLRTWSIWAGDGIGVAWRVLLGVSLPDIWPRRIVANCSGLPARSLRIELSKCIRTQTGSSNAKNNKIIKTSSKINYVLNI
jgi:hypothetical protein